MEELISQVVHTFYSKAVQDPIIGYHFRKIQELQSDDVLRPPIEAFAKHLPRIESFWRLQLLGMPLPQSEQPFNLIQVHSYLRLNKGEIGRWVTLFNQTLDSLENDDNVTFFKDWRDKLKQFERRFLNSPHLFSD